MATIHQIKCDGCGIIEKIFVYKYHVLKPSGWCNEFGKDFCPTCYKKIKKHLLKVLKEVNNDKI